MPSLGEVWEPAAVIVGFQLLAFSWRLNHEVDAHKRGDRWVPPADWLNVAALVVMLGGVFALPILSLPASAEFARDALGLSVLLFAGYPFALAGHYRLIGPKAPAATNTVVSGQAPDQPYKTGAELLTIIVVAILAVAYVATAAVR